jgi:hypothetical protein
LPTIGAAAAAALDNPVRRAVLVALNRSGLPLTQAELVECLDPRMRWRTSDHLRELMAIGCVGVTDASAPARRYYYSLVVDDPDFCWHLENVPPYRHPLSAI